MSPSELEERIRETCARHDAVLCVYLFGSAGRGEAKPHDVDVAVLFAERQEAKLMSLPFELAGELERALGQPVDLIDLHRAPPDLIHRILRDSRLLLDRNPSRRIAFEVRARNEYFDLEPVRREYRRLGRRKQP